VGEFHREHAAGLSRSPNRRDYPDPIFHVIYDLDQRYQVPGAQYLRSGRTYEQDGVTPRWRGIYDDKGQLMGAICRNMDLGDSWEHADNLSTTKSSPRSASALASTT
jgi:hypothetical protein